MNSNRDTLLSSIHSPADLRKLKPEQLPQLTEEVRSFILDVVSVKPGHLGASLGVVELTVALHYVLNTPDDRLVWDVGHQAYGHKILTGRKDIFHTLRQLKGISGFPSRTESEFDAFGTGHASTSISAILGMAMASRLKGESNRQHIAVIGDGALTGGMAVEALNNAGVSNANILVVLNDNGIAIDHNVGVIKRSVLKSRNLFHAINFKYFGPVDGNDVMQVVKALQEIQDTKGPKLLHIMTTKGKGFEKAEQQQTLYHAPGRFDRKTGEQINEQKDESVLTYQEVFGKTITELAEKDEKIVAVTPAMPTGSALIEMMQKLPGRVFDVGIAEQHAVTFSAGLSAEGFKPFCTIYSTFLQRAYDQIIHDVALQKLPVVFCIDRAGLVGEDGATHHGVFDLAFLRTIPNMVVTAPLNEADFRNLLFSAANYKAGPFAIRYPRSRGVLKNWKQPFEKFEIGKGKQIKQGKETAILSLGHVGNFALEAIEHLQNEAIGLYDMRFLKPIDENLLHHVFTHYKNIITLEGGSLKGGLADAVAAFKSQHNYNAKLITLGVPDRFIEHGTQEELRKECGFDVDGILKVLREIHS
ncbi:MAG: 1-deoxy-D-xylulose-5-phosphate synthase [Bacteroidetes bacterium]|nr:MAG: 1-deoxy-D-xylulose-5-phosphate synthase [Bacteroidota bacterium]